MDIFSMLFSRVYGFLFLLSQFQLQNFTNCHHVWIVNWLVVKISFLWSSSNPNTFCIGSWLYSDYPHNYHFSMDIGSQITGRSLFDLENKPMPVDRLVVGIYATFCVYATPLNRIFKGFQHHSSAVRFVSTGAGGGVTCSTGAEQDAGAATFFLLSTKLPKAIRGGDTIGLTGN